MNLPSDKILLTGATGMLGGHMLWHLLQSGVGVRALKRRQSNFEQVELIFNFYGDKLSRYASRIEWVEGDVLDASSIHKAMKGVAVVYHCAARVSFSDAEGNLSEINVAGTQHVVEEAFKNKVQRFCFVSSIGALNSSKTVGMVDEACFGELEAEASAYSQSKNLSERVVWKAIANGLPAVVVNPGVIMGYAGAENGTMKLFDLVARGLPAYTKGGSGYVCVADVCRAMMLLTQGSDMVGERFVVVGENLSNRDLLNMIADSIGAKRPYICASRFLLMAAVRIMELWQKITGKKFFLDRATAEVLLSRTYYSSEKIKRSLGFEFTPIKACVEKIGALYKEKNETVSFLQSI